MNNKIYLIVSIWSYPFGGGEEFLYQSLDWSTSLGMKSYWISFSTANNIPHKEYKVTKIHNGARLIEIPGGYTEKKLYTWLKLIGPDIVHHQGHHRKNIFDVCKSLRIEFMTGIHFWSGCILLDSQHKNINIVENYDKHKIDPDFEYLTNQKYCHFYSVSPFVTDAIKKITNINVKHMIYSGSSIKTCRIIKNNPIINKYVTVINIHKGKGGDIALFLMKEFKNIPFFCIKTEYGSEELDDEIMNFINERNKTAITKSIFSQRINDPKLIYKDTKIFLAPSLVDETFCRTVNEAMMNGIPVITTGQGNIKYLMGFNKDYIIDINDKDAWKNRLDMLYNIQKEYLKASQFVTKQYEEFSEKKQISMFNDTMTEIINNSKENNVMIFTPWCDQGLGIQSRNYYNILSSNGFNAFIFAVKPYNANTCIELQKNKDEWIVDNIYYSPNDREHITDVELIDFIEKYNIGKCIIPETSWYRVFEIAKLMRENNVKCYAIPNIEIVRKDEVYKHQYFYKILCNNMLCKNIFNNYGITNTDYIGYGISDNITFEPTKLNNDALCFLFIGGMNAFSRKHILLICEAFEKAVIKCPNIKLTCTIQKTNLLEIEDANKIQHYFNHPNISIIQDHMPYNKILELYKSHHISIQVSKHEGLGLGFYEGLFTGTPIITLNTPPHNEIIINNVNGWVIPCYHKDMTDNKDPLFQSAYFDPVVLADKIVELSNNKMLYNNILKTLTRDLNTRLNFSTFSKRFISSLQ